MTACGIHRQARHGNVDAPSTYVVCSSTSFIKHCGKTAGPRSASQLRRGHEDKADRASSSVRHGGRECSSKKGQTTPQAQVRTRVITGQSRSVRGSKKSESGQSVKVRHTRQGRAEIRQRNSQSRLQRQTMRLRPSKTGKSELK